MADSENSIDSAVDPSHIRTRQEFGRGLTALREAAGLPVRDLAKELKLPTSTVSGYLVGRHLPPLRFPHLLPDLLQACGIVDQNEIEAWNQALSRVRRAASGRRTDDDAPYPGLVSYQPEQARWFHGREAMVDAAVATLMAKGGVVVVGASGSGKSSLLRAGVIPAMAGDGSEEMEQSWQAVLLTPGAQPLAALAAGCAGLLGTADVDLVSLAHEDPPGFLARLQNLWSRAGQDDRGLLLVIDQLEELFTVCDDPVERQVFLEAVCPRPGGTATADAPAATDRVLVALGLRADFYPQTLDWPALANLVQHAQIVVSPMSPDELRRAITEPARVAGVGFEDGLVELLLREIAPSALDQAAAHDPGSLPLLGHALLATWDRRKHGVLSVEAYRETGGIRSAVARTADEVYSQLDAEQQDLARQMFLRLVHVADRTADTRRRATRQEMLPDLSSSPEQLDGVLEAFIEHRLVTSSLGTVDIAHEALLTAWPRLRSWIDEDRAGLRTHRKLGDAATAWQENDRDPHRLYRGAALAAATDWAGEPAHENSLNALEREFLAVSTLQEQAEARARRLRVRRLRQYAVSLTVLVVLVALLADYAFRQRGTANHQRALATAQRNSAISRQVAIEANTVRSTDTALAAQLALAAYRISPTTEARTAVLDSYSSPTATRLSTGSSVVQGLAVSPDGRTMAACGNGGSVRVWDLTNPQQPKPLAALPIGDKATMFTAAFSPDGHTLAIGGAGPAKGTSVLRLWDVSNRAHPADLGALTGFTNTVFSATFSPDGRILAAGAADDTIRLWDVTAPARPRPLGSPLSGFRDYVQVVRFSPDGHLLAAGGRDSTVRLWDVTNATAPVPLGVPLTGPSQTVYSLAFRPDSRVLAEGSSDSSVRLWNVSDPAHPSATGPVLSGPTSWINALSFSSDGAELAAGSSDSKLWLWDSATGAPLASLPHPGPVASATFLPHSATVITGSADGYVRLWQLPGPVIAPVAKHESNIAIVGGHLLITGAASGPAGIWNVADPRHPRRLGPPLNPPSGAEPFSGSVAATLDGSTLAVGSNDGTVRLWDLSDPAHPALRPDVLTGLTSTVETLAFSPDGHYLAGGADEATIRLWDVAKGGAPRTLPALSGPTNYVYSLVFSPDGRTLAAGSVDSTVRLWDVTNIAAPVPLGKPLTELSNYVYSVAFSPDGNTLAAAGADHTVQLWDVHERAQARPFGPPVTGPNNTIYAIAFSSDGNTLAGANGEGTVWLWDVTDRRTPKPLAALAGPGKEALAVSFDPKAEVLVAGGYSDSIRLWDTNVADVSGQLCASMGDPITPKEWSRYIQDVVYAPPCAQR